METYPCRLCRSIPRENAFSRNGCTFKITKVPTMSSTTAIHTITELQCQFTSQSLHHRRGQEFVGGFLYYVEHINTRIMRPQGGSGSMSPRKSLDFRPSDITSEEYRARIPQIMQTARLALEAYALAGVAL